MELCDKVMRWVIFKLHLLKSALNWFTNNPCWSRRGSYKSRTDVIGAQWIVFLLTIGRTKWPFHRSFCSFWRTPAFIVFATCKAVSVKVQSRQSMWEKRMSVCLQRQGRACLVYIHNSTASTFSFLLACLTSVSVLKSWRRDPTKGRIVDVTQTLSIPY